MTTDRMVIAAERDGVALAASLRGSTAIPKATVHRLLRSLVKGGALQASTSPPILYALGPRIHHVLELLCVTPRTILLFKFPS